MKSYKESFINTIMWFPSVFIAVGMVYMIASIFRPEDWSGDEFGAKIVQTKEYFQIMEDKNVRYELIWRNDLSWVDFDIHEGKHLWYYYIKNGQLEKDIMPLYASKKLIKKFIDDLRELNK